MPIFQIKENLGKALEIMEYYCRDEAVSFSHFKRLTPELKQTFFEVSKNKPRLIEIYAFSFMPNHYHLLLRQLVDGGIERFIATVQNSFAKNYNLINNRKSPVFDDRFKAKIVTSNEEFLHLSRYIHLQYVTSKIITLDELSTHPWSSFPNYMSPSLQTPGFVNTERILAHFGSREKYREFVFNQADYQRKLHVIKQHLKLEKEANKPRGLQLREG